MSFVRLYLTSITHCSIGWHMRSVSLISMWFISNELVCVLTLFVHCLLDQLMRVLFVWYSCPGSVNGVNDKQQAYSSLDQAKNNPSQLPLISLVRWFDSNLIGWRIGSNMIGWWMMQISAICHGSETVLQSANLMANYSNVAQPSHAIVCHFRKFLVG